MYVLHLDFLPDIDRNIVEAAKRREIMNCATLKSLPPILKRITLALVLSMDVGILVYLYLVVASRSEDRQIAWMETFFIWLCLDVFVISPSVVLINCVLLPSLSLKRVFIAKRIVADLIAKLQQLPQNNSSAEVENGNQYELNAAGFLFVSLRLAKLLPHTPESRTILKFTTPWLRRSYHEVFQVESCGVVFNALRKSFKIYLNMPNILQNFMVEMVLIVISAFFVLAMRDAYMLFPAIPFIVLIVFFIIGALWLKFIDEAEDRASDDAEGAPLPYSLALTEQAHSQRVIRAAAPRRLSVIDGLKAKLGIATVVPISEHDEIQNDVVDDEVNDDSHDSGSEIKYSPTDSDSTIERDRQREEKKARGAAMNSGAKNESSSDSDDPWKNVSNVRQRRGVGYMTDAWKSAKPLQSVPNRDASIEDTGTNNLKSVGAETSTNHSTPPLSEVDNADNRKFSTGTIVEPRSEKPIRENVGDDRPGSRSTDSDIEGASSYTVQSSRRTALPTSIPLTQEWLDAHPRPPPSSSSDGSSDSNDDMLTDSSDEKVVVTQRATIVQVRHRRGGTEIESNSLVEAAKKHKQLRDYESDSAEEQGQRLKDTIEDKIMEESVVSAGLRSIESAVISQPVSHSSRSNIKLNIDSDDSDDLHDIEAAMIATRAKLVTEEGLQAKYVAPMAASSEIGALGSASSSVAGVTFQATAQKLPGDVFQKQGFGTGFPTDDVVPHGSWSSVNPAMESYDSDKDFDDIEAAMAATRAKVAAASSSMNEPTVFPQASQELSSVQSNGFPALDKDHRPQSASSPGLFATDHYESSPTPAAQPSSSLTVSILVDNLSPESAMSAPVTMDTPSPVRKAKLFDVEISDDDSDSLPQNLIEISKNRDETKIKAELQPSLTSDKVDFKHEVSNHSSQPEVQAQLTTEVDILDWEAPEQSTSLEIAHQSALAPQPQVSQSINISSWEDENAVDVSSNVKANASTFPMGSDGQEEILDGESLESYSFPMPKSFGGGADDASQLFVPTETPLFVDMARPMSRDSNSDEELAAALENLNSYKNP
jgi:hypothetical protein